MNAIVRAGQMGIVMAVLFLLNRWLHTMGTDFILGAFSMLVFIHAAHRIFKGYWLDF